MKRSKKEMQQMAMGNLQGFSDEHLYTTMQILVILERAFDDQLTTSQAAVFLSEVRRIKAITAKTFINSDGFKGGGE